MNQILDRIPKLLLGFLIILGTLTFMVYNDPPTSVCDIQMKAVNEKLKNYFYSTKKQGRIKGGGVVVGAGGGAYQTGIGSAFQFCMKNNSSGGCFDMLTRLKFFEKQIRTIPKECGAHPSIGKVQGALEKGIKLIAKIGWGAKPPETLFDKKAWLDETDLALFCRLKREHRRLFGKQRWQGFRESVIMILPEANKLPRKKRWEKSLFSYPCKGLL